MNRSRSFSWKARGLAIAGALGLVAACTPRTFTSGSNPACGLSSDSVRRLTRAQFLSWASRVQFDSTAPVWGRPHGAGTTGISVYRASDMERTDRSNLADGCVIARIRSATADANLGLGAGWTYVWADSTNPYTATMVPEQEGVAVTEFRLTLESGEPDPGTIASPRYICSDCGNDWCVYPRDGLRSEPALFSPGE